MKKLLLILMIVCFKGYSQDLKYENFKLENGNLIWEKIYKSELSKIDLIRSLKTSGIIKDFKETENYITGYIEHLILDYKGFGNSEMRTAAYISGNYLRSFVLVEFKSGKYRVTLKEIKLSKRFKDKTSDHGEINELKYYAIKSNNLKFRTSFKKSPSGILNYTFDKIFNITNKTNDDW